MSRFVNTVCKGVVRDQNFIGILNQFGLEKIFISNQSVI